jgi:hypothetical protein
LGVVDPEEVVDRGRDKRGWVGGDFDTAGSLGFPSPAGEELDEGGEDIGDCRTEGLLLIGVFLIELLQSFVGFEEVADGCEIDRGAIGRRFFAPDFHSTDDAAARFHVGARLGLHRYGGELDGAEEAEAMERVGKMAASEISFEADVGR